MKPRLIYPAMLLVLAGVGLGVRVVRLDDRPMHADEAVQAAIFRKFWWEGHYSYNPDEFHGPTLSFATAPVLWVAGPECFAQTRAVHYRVVPALFGAAAVSLVWLLRDAVGRTPSLLAAGLLAVSPAMVYYSRYYIHETLLAFLTLAAVGAGWRYFRTGRLAWCLTAGACLGVMQATKETSPITFFAMGGALLGAWLWQRRQPDRPDPLPRVGSWRQLGLGALTAVLVWATLISSFYTNARGLLDGLLTYGPWLRRAGGASSHVQPWTYYLHLLGGWRQGDGPAFPEGVVLLLAAMGLAALLLSRSWLPRDANRPFLRWLACYTVLLAASYSAIPYKTPWCVLGMLQGLILLAAVGAVAAVRATPGAPLRGLLGVALLAGGGYLAWQSYQVNFLMPADPRNPYSYAHTLPDAERLAETLAHLGPAIPAEETMPVTVIWHDGYYWPLPWYLRRFDQVSYWTALPADPSAPLVIASPEFDEALTEKLGRSHLMTGYYGLRPNVLAQLWVRDDVWIAHLRRQGRL